MTTNKNDPQKHNDNQTPERLCCEGQGQIEKARDAAVEKRATEPTQEAKQVAAERGFDPSAEGESYNDFLNFCEGYDIAMSKLAKRVEVMKKQQAVLERMLSDRDNEQESQPDA